jgi:hypothetical protein
MTARRLVLQAFATLLACLSLAAAAAGYIEDRSPFRQGHWWDPGRSGHGFEILNTGDQVFVVWYTYDAAESPIWYTAQGGVGTMGSSWPLLKHRWSGNRVVESATVGQLRLSVNHFESMTAAWELNGAQGTWKIEPFVQSGIINEVDLTGHWYDPDNSGWGMTLLDQGDVFGAVIYAYGAEGQPTWVAGFDRGKGTRIDLHWTRGACPSCAYRIVGSSPVGSIDIGYRGDTEITVRGAPTIALAAGLRIDGAKGRQMGRPASTRTADYQLAPFRGDRLLKDLLVAGLEHRLFGSSGSDFSAAPPLSSVSFSTTNLQVAGVDEADVLKSDGRFVYAVTPITYQTSPPYASSRKIRIARVGDGGSDVTPVGELPISVTPGRTSYTWDAGLYLHAGNLVTIATSQYYFGWFYSPASTTETNIEFFGLADPAAPASRYRATLPGTMVSSRRIGDRLYVVTRFTPHIPGYVSYAYTDAQRAANRDLARATPVTEMLPWISENGGPKAMTTPLSSIYAPQFGANTAVADMVVVSAFDIREGRLVQSLAIVGRTEAMFVSSSAIYLASSRYDTRPISSSLLPSQRSLLNTDVHKIAIDGDMRLVGSGSVEGWVNGSWNADKAAFRFGEVDGRLGIVTSTTLGWWGPNSNRVTLLEPSGATPGLLKTVSWLPNAQRPQTLGKPGEALYGTRFVGNKLYAVTFRQVDPLYVVDLANANDPRITGELEIPGFSDYLHPLGNGLLLGFGREATPDGWMQGLHLTLFDVSGSAPREMQRMTIGKRGSDSALFRSHHAMSTLQKPDGSTAVAFPVSVADGAPSGSGPSAWYPWAYSGLIRFDVVGNTPADARIVFDKALVTARAGAPASPSYDEGSSGQARSVLFPDASVYVSSGLFYQQSASAVVIGPY